MIYSSDTCLNLIDATPPEKCHHHHQHHHHQRILIVRRTSIYIYHIIYIFLSLTFARFRLLSLPGICPCSHFIFIFFCFFFLSEYETTQLHTIFPMNEWIWNIFFFFTVGWLVGCCACWAGRFGIYTTSSFAIINIAHTYTHKKSNKQTSKPKTREEKKKILLNWMKCDSPKVHCETWQKLD